MLALTENNEFDGQEITIGGPEALKGDDIARHLSKSLGLNIEFQSMPIPEFGKIMAGLFADRNSFDVKKKYPMNWRKFTLGITRPPLSLSR